ncbi:isoform b [Stylonychia lemnae]|uniref:Isoform b n=1 Tax=Stylonychia lemnae TaxID=5949 RepID=A0A078B935_STYLE|nr:isoform b [Stylonychia lemnae]|eukprot:CDW90884.1 isoform b [Stylonychia lemnae]
MAISLKNIKSLVKKKQQQNQIVEEVKQEELKTTLNQQEIIQPFLDSFSINAVKQFDIEDFKVKGTDQAYYIKNYISIESEQHLLNCITKLDQDRWFEMKSGRALKRYGGEVGSNGLLNQESLPSYFEIIAQNLSDSGIFPEYKPNHVLLNKYRPGDGIFAHKDGPSYFPFVCILSLNSGIILYVKETLEGLNERKNYRARFYLEPRSLFIFTQTHYDTHFHGIDEDLEDVVSIKNDNDFKVDNLEMTDILQTYQAGEDGLIHIPRVEERLSLTIRYVPSLQE